MGKKNKPNAKLMFLDFIPADAKRVLDVGCAEGTFSENLIKKGHQVVGIDRDAEALKVARSRLTEVYNGDIESAQFPFEEKSFDCILFADVLDCLIDPLALLIKYRKYLKEDGCFVVSFANVRYYKVITNLLFRGTWDYMEQGGILWIHHLRFYTFISMVELFAKAGFRIETFERYIYAKGFIRFLNVMCFGKLKELMTYQYYFRLEMRPDWVEGTYKSTRKKAHY